MTELAGASGSASSLFAIMIPVAPEAPARATFKPNSQTPLSTRAIWPDTVVGKSEASQPRAA